MSIKLVHLHPRAQRETTQSSAATIHDAGLPGASNAEDINVAVRSESALVKDIYTSESGQVPTVQLGQPTSMTVAGSPAVQVVASVSDIETSPCQGPTAIHLMIATTVPGQPGCVMFIMGLPQRTDGAVSPDDALHIVSTLRKAG